VANALEMESAITFFDSISIGFIVIMENLQYFGHKSFVNCHRACKRSGISPDVFIE
jgi:hypothetical protein